MLMFVFGRRCRFLRRNKRRARGHELPHQRLLHEHARRRGLQEGLALAPTEALFRRALALEDAGRIEEALGCYELLLAQQPAHADAWHNRGLLLARLGRLPEAEESHRRYVRHHPESPRARCDLADVLLAVGRYDDVIELLASAQDRPPGRGEMLVRRGLALACMRRFAHARADFEAAFRGSPAEVEKFVRRAAPSGDREEILSPENIFLARGYESQSQCNWTSWREYTEEMRAVAASQGDIVLEPAVAFMALLAPLAGHHRHAIARQVARRIERKAPAMPPPRPRSRKRIRVGFLSPDLRDHVVGRLLVPLFEALDRSRFEVIAYALNANDGSAVRERLANATDLFRELNRLSDSHAAALIRADDVDILMDMCGHMTGGRAAITFQRPARIQVNYAGFSGSLASRRIDFAIVDRVVAPDDSEWTESLVHLPTTFYLYDFRRPIPEPSITRAEYGLPNERFVFCAFHNAHKITPDVFETWMEILRQAPNSILWFRALSDTARQNLASAAAALGIDPVRLVFAPFEASDGPRYLPRHRLGDLLLDAFHHNAVTNACDALGMGLPVLTLRGDSMATRAGESLLRAAGLPELVCADRKAFVRSAVDFARSPEQLSDYKRRLVQARQTAPLFDTVGRVREIEVCLEHMVQVSDQPRSRL
jgi:protein O-GlcNAc transferase